MLQSPIIDGLRGRNISMPSSLPNHCGPTSPNVRRTKSSTPTQHSSPQHPSLGLPWMSPRYLSADAEENIRLTIELEPHTHPMTAMESLLAEDLSATAVCTDVGVLLRSVAKFFSVEVLVSLEQTLEIWDIQSLPEITMFHAAQHIFHTFVVRCATKSSTGSTGCTGSGSTGQSVSTSDESSATPSAGNGGGQISRYTNGAPDSSGRNDPPDQSTDNSLIQNRPLPGDGFRKAARRTVVQTEFRSPTRINRSATLQNRNHSNEIRTRVISRAAVHFDTAFHQNSNLPAAFGDTTSSIAVLYHVTRAHNLSNFLSRGVVFREIDFRPNELHHRSAFYLSNVVANGVSHVLHYKFNPENNLDPLLVFSFAVDTNIILGNSPYTGNLHFKTRIIEVPPNPLDLGYRVRYQEFCQFVRKNWSQAWSEEEREELDKFDFVVAPICERPTNNSVGITPHLTDSGPQLMQVAACSDDARAYLNSAIVEIVNEDCHPPPPT